MKRKVFVFAMLVVLVGVTGAWAVPVQQQIPFTKKTTLSYPKTYTMRFSLWDADVGGVEVWSEEKDVRLNSSTLKTYLGDDTPLDSLDFTQQLWVKVERWKASTSSWIPVGSTRDRLVANPYAIGNTAGANFADFPSGGAISFTSAITNIISLTISAPGPGVVIFNASGLMALRAHTNGTRDEIRCSISSAVDGIETPNSGVLVPASAPTASELSHGAPIGLTKAVTVSAEGDVSGFLNCWLVSGGGGSDAFVQYGQMSAIFVPTQY